MYADCVPAGEACSSACSRAMCSFPAAESAQVPGVFLLFPWPSFYMLLLLQVDSEGRKFGKSTGGAIWLSADKLSPYKFYQYLFQVRERVSVRCLLYIIAAGCISRNVANSGSPSSSVCHPSFWFR